MNDSRPANAPSDPHHAAANPYAPPHAQMDGAGQTNPLMLPAAMLVALSSTILLLLLASLPVQMVTLATIDSSTSAGLGELTAGIVALLALILTAGAILYGSICMLRLTNYRFAFAAAVAATIPGCSPFVVLGIPLGIWALVVLMQPQVRTRFRQNDAR